MPRFSRCLPSPNGLVVRRLVNPEHGSAIGAMAGAGGDSAPRGPPAKRRADEFQGRPAKRRASQFEEQRRRTFAQTPEEEIVNGILLQSPVENAAKFPNPWRTFQDVDHAGHDTARASASGA